MDRSDDLSRSRRFNALELGSGRARPKIVTSKDERVAPHQSDTANRPPQPSLEFRARQRLRTYAEAATVLDRQAPRDAAGARRNGPSELNPPERTTIDRAPDPNPAPELGFGDVIPEPPSPMAEAYVGRSPQLTQRQAEHHNLETANTLVEPEADPAPTLTRPVTDAAITTSGSDGQDMMIEPAITAPALESEPQTTFAPATSEPQDGPKQASSLDHSAYDDPALAGPTDSSDLNHAPMNTAYQSAAAETSGGIAGLPPLAGGLIGKASDMLGTFTSKSALVAKSLVANIDSMWQNTTQRIGQLVSETPALSNFAAQSGAGVKGRVSRLPANSLLTPQMGSLAASARADSSHARPDANVRPVKGEGVLQQEPEPRRTLLARKIQDNVERTETRAAVPAGPITQIKQGRMAFSSLALILVTLVLLAAAAWATISIMQRTNTPITTIGQTERYRIEAVLDALFINPGPVDGIIDDRTSMAITQYAVEYGYSGPQSVSAPLLQHLEDEAEAMGLLDLIQ